MGHHPHSSEQTRILRRVRAQDEGVFPSPLLLRFKAPPHDTKMAFQTALLAVLAALAAPALASPLSPRWWINPDPVYPKVKSSSLVGVLDDPTLQRDSCGSVKWDGRLLWVCRDTEFLVNESIHDLVTNNTLYGFATSSASYTNFAPGGGPDVEPLASNPYIPFENQVPQYGYNSNETNFYPLSPDQCSNNTAGNCYDGTRFALWPAVPPLVTSWDGGLTAYTWVRNEHITNTLGVVTPDPSTTLYKVTSAPWGSAGDVLPSVEIVDEFFWQENGELRGAGAWQRSTCLVES